MDKGWLTAMPCLSAWPHNIWRPSGLNAWPHTAAYNPQAVDLLCLVHDALQVLLVLGSMLHITASVALQITSVKTCH